MCHALVDRLCSLHKPIKRYTLHSRHKLRCPPPSAHDDAVPTARSRARAPTRHGHATRATKREPNAHAAKAYAYHTEAYGMPNRPRPKARNKVSQFIHSAPRVDQRYASRRAVRELHRALRQLEHGVTELQPGKSIRLMCHCAPEKVPRTRYRVRNPMPTASAGHAHPRG